MRKRDEIIFYQTLMRRTFAGVSTSPQNVAVELGMPLMRAHRICEKWCDKEWMDFGTRPLVGFFTPDAPEWIGPWKVGPTLGYWPHQRDAS